MCPNESLAYRAVVTTLVIFMFGFLVGYITNCESEHDRENRRNVRAVQLKNMEILAEQGRLEIPK